MQLLRAGPEELGGFATLRFMDFLMPEALFRAGEITEALTTVDQAITRSTETEEHRLMAELLRLKGEILLFDGGAEGEAVAQDLFRQSLDWARRQRALSWELRTATSLARLWREKGRTGDAADLLQPVYDRFTEGFGTADIETAEALLGTLR
jgi:predicted ATPase